ncbi:Rrn6 protein [Saccharomycopsis crataegensis]|uniref:Rrn6 protein n=1 Tax=Saccharomycopsis crataegensis TaxID=43959 RepID=A0AAV5QH21_9ASCO|nr:Rrn6 protein [Saccharomycopsis crataegensis]
MWPAKDDLGSKIIYGIDGYPLYSTENNGKGRWDFPKTQRDTRLFKVKYSSKRVVNEPDASNFRRSNALDSSFKHDLSQISAGLRKELLSESDNWDSHFIYDPSVGHLLMTSLLKQLRSEHCIRVVAFSSGSIANVAVLESGIDELSVGLPANNKPEAKVSVEYPRLGARMGIDVRSTIKQIEFPSNPNPTLVPSRFFAVRTEFEVFIFKVYPKYHVGPPEVKIELVGSIKSFEVRLDSFSDVTFNCWDLSQFAIIDKNGKWKTWVIKERNLKPLVDSPVFGNIGNSQDLSNWRKVIWGSSSNEILLFDRLNVHKVTCANGKTKTRNLFKPERKSQFLQIERCNDEPSELFILTSQKMMWVKLENDEFKIIMTWNHLLNPDDVSLRFSLNYDNYANSSRQFQAKNYDDGTNFSDSRRSYLVIIHSFIHSSNVFQRFEYSKDLNTHTMVGDPFLVKINLDTVVRDTLLLPVTLTGPHNAELNDIKEGGDMGPQFSHKYASFFQLSRGLGITRTLLSTNSCSTIYKYRDLDLNELITQKKIDIDNIVSTEIEEMVIRSNNFYKIFKPQANSNEIKGIHKTLFTRVSHKKKFNRDVQDLLPEENEIAFKSLSLFQRDVLRSVMINVFHTNSTENDNDMIESASQVEGQIRSILLKNVSNPEALTNVIKTVSTEFIYDLLSRMSNLTPDPFSSDSRKIETQEDDDHIDEYEDLQSQIDKEGYILEGFKMNKLHARVRLIVEQWDGDNEFSSTMNTSEKINIYNDETLLINTQKDNTVVDSQYERYSNFYSQTQTPQLMLSQPTALGSTLSQSKSKSLSQAPRKKKRKKGGFA